MKYYKVNENKEVIHIRNKPDEGFLSTDQNIACGMISNGDGTFSIPETPEDPGDNISRSVKIIGEDGKTYELSVSAGGELKVKNKDKEKTVLYKPLQ